MIGVTKGVAFRKSFQKSLKINIWQNEENEWKNMWNSDLWNNAWP